MSAASRTRQGNSAAERNPSALQLPRKEQSTVSIINWGVTFSLTKKQQQKKTTRKNTCVGALGGRMRFCTKVGHFVCSARQEGKCSKI